MGAEVIKLNNNNEVYEYMEIFFDDKRRGSEETEKEYRRDIQDFFNITREGTNIAFLTKDQIQVTYKDFNTFINATEGKIANSTINRKIAAMKSLLKFLHAMPNFENRIVKDIGYLSQVKTLKHNPNEYGVLEVHEVYEIAEFLRQDKDRGEEKFYAVLLSLDTCIRKGALLKLKWSDFVVRGERVYLKYIDKGNKEFRKEIGRKFYDELKSIKVKGQEEVFSLATRTLNKMMDRALAKLNIDKNRNVTWHSIRKAGATYSYKRTGDVLQVQQMLGHSSLVTTQRYLAKQEYSPLGAVSDRGNYDEELYKKVEKEVLIQAIEGMSKSQIYLLNEQIQKLQEGNK